MRLEVIKLIVASVFCNLRCSSRACTPLPIHNLPRQSGCNSRIVSPTCCDWIPCKGEQICYKHLWSTSSVYGDSCMGTSNVQCWVKYFEDDDRDITNLYCSDWPRTITMECNKQKIDAYITEDKRAMVREIVVLCGIGHSAVQKMKKTLGYRNFAVIGFPNCWWMNTKGMHGCVIAVTSLTCFEAWWLPSELLNW